MKNHECPVGVKRAVKILECGLFLVSILLIYICAYLYNSISFNIYEAPYKVMEKTVEMLEYAFMTLTIVIGGSMLYIFTE